MAATRELEGCPIGSQALVFVQLADIHFKTDQSAYKAVQDDVKEQVRRDVARISKELPPVAGVLLCGDIAYSGASAEYSAAREWLQTVSDAAACHRESVWTVPGNHDVDRRGWDHNHSLQAFHKALRAQDVNAIDDQIRRFTREDPNAGRTLLDPLRSYNEFAAAYGCDIAPERLHWEDQLPLNDGSALKIRGLTSVLVSDETDDNGANKLIIGTVQTSFVEQDGVEFLTLCHHPPSWMFDEDRMENSLNARVRVQLFGHKHRQVVNQIDNLVRMTAGAAFPSQREPNWVPRYNVLSVEVAGTGGDRRLHVTIVPRVWHEQSRRFVAEPSDVGQPWRSVDLDLAAWTRPTQGDPAPTTAPPAPKPSPPASPALAPASPPATVVPAMDARRRLTYRFLGLTFDKRFAVAERLALVKPEDRDADETQRARRFFARAVAGNLLAALWDAVESYYPDRDQRNPFKDSAS